jgi:hypothetical protein
MPLLFLLMNTCFTGGGKFFIQATQGAERRGCLCVLRSVKDLLNEQTEEYGLISDLRYLINNYFQMLEF